MSTALKSFIFGVAALAAAAVWASIGNLNPPFDAAGWSDIIVWLVGLLLAGVGGWQFKNMRWQNKSVNLYGMENANGYKMTEKEAPAWANLLLAIIALVAAFFWPEVLKLAPPFEQETFVKIITWLATIGIASVGGWNVKALLLKK